MKKVNDIAFFTSKYHWMLVKFCGQVQYEEKKLNTLATDFILKIQIAMIINLKTYSIGFFLEPFFH